MPKFEFHAYRADANGTLPEVAIHDYAEVTQAKAYAGRLSKRINGPVDLAYAGDRPWNDRYIATAEPVECYGKGYRVTRLT